jgi:hypothetical protein
MEAVETSRKDNRVLLVRGVDSKLYAELWNLRRSMGARSWADMLRRIVEEWREEHGWL